MLRMGDDRMMTLPYQADILEYPLSLLERQNCARISGQLGIELLHHDTPDRDQPPFKDPALWGCKPEPPKIPPAVPTINRQAA